MHKYTTEQIKKALECCTDGTGKGIIEAVLDLIKRQEAEKAELQREIASYKSEIDRLERDGLTEAHYKALYGAVYALADMVFQFGYSTTFRNKDAVCDGGLSALENAFCALLNCGCRTNSNGTISIKNLLEFQSEFKAKMVGESDV